MGVDDDLLLEIDESQLQDYDRAAAERALRQFGDAFRYQLVAARHIENWADDIEAGREAPDAPHPRFSDGVLYALRDVAAQLRCGDYLPGGLRYEETVAEGFRPRR
jgi:hypothetical protein